MSTTFSLPGPDLATDVGMTDTQTPNASDLPTIVIGCMDRLDEYQNLLTKLWQVEGKDKVRGEMVDRVVQGGESQFKFQQKLVVAETRY
jgi:hypothetical protein